MSLGAGVINLLEDKKRAARANFKRTHYETWTAIHYAWAYMTNPQITHKGVEKLQARVISWRKSFVGKVVTLKEIQAVLSAQHALLCFLEEMTFVVSRRKMSYDNGMSEAAANDISRINRD